MESLGPKTDTTCELCGEVPGVAVHHIRTVCDDRQHARLVCRGCADNFQTDRARNTWCAPDKGRRPHDLPAGMLRDCNAHWKRLFPSLTLPDYSGVTMPDLESILYETAPSDCDCGYCGEGVRMDTDQGPMTCRACGLGLMVPPLVFFRMV